MYSCEGLRFFTDRVETYSPSVLLSREKVKVSNLREGSKMVLT